MSRFEVTKTFALDGRTVNRIGYGAMHLSGPGIFGPPKDRDTALAVLREAVSQGVNHIDTSDFYGSQVTNQIIREALHPYPDDLVIVTKVGAKRGSDGSVHPAMSRPEGGTLRLCHRIRPDHAAGECRSSQKRRCSCKGLFRRGLCLMVECDQGAGAWPDPAHGRKPIERPQGPSPPDRPAS